MAYGESKSAAELRAACQPEPGDGPFTTEVKRTLLEGLQPWFPHACVEIRNAPDVFPEDWVEILD